METGTLISLIAYFVLMLGIGLYAWRKSTSNAAEYMLGGRSLGPGVAALSAGASDMSGWLLMGLPGAIYVSGLSQAWIGIGLVVGAYANYLLVAPRLRTYTEVARDAITIPDYLAERFEDRSHTLRILSAVVIIVFFTLYTSAGMVSGGKLAQSAFGMDYATGIYMTAAVVVAYTLFGGFLAVSLTDFVQGCIMFVALVLVPIVAFDQFGSLSDLAASIGRVEADKGLAPGAFSSLFTGTTALGIVSAAAWGLGYFGQPHIIVRFMAVRSVRDVPTMRRIGMGWMIVALVGALATGYVGAAYVRNTGASIVDSETIFIFFSQVLFHPLVTGFLLAAILAAIMSTISSQLLVSSSSLTEDIYRLFNRDAGDRQLVTIGRGAVLVVAIVAALLAMDPDSSILGLVSNAWAGFGAAFGPLILLSLLWRRTTLAGALAGIVVGAAVVIAWIAMGLSDTMYEIVPGFIASGLAIWIVSKATPAPSTAVTATFDRARAYALSGSDTAPPAPVAD
ncbi:MAG: sodium/proline symporter PutP [Sphingomonadales bacterium]|nr:sodium/proline symporter PutP [Sphingomonadales bacterium]